MQVEQIIPKSNSLEDLQEYIAECASVVRDKSPKSAEKLWNRLLKESFGGTASRVLEYVPCAVVIPFQNLLDKYYYVNQFFGFELIINEQAVYHTTMRELLNWGWTVEECLETVDFTHYRAFKCETPYFMYGQLRTHNQITSVSHSQRYGTCDRGYWMPPELASTYDGIRFDWNEEVESCSPNNLKLIMKTHGIARKEVWDRGADMLQNRVFTLGGYIQPNGWTHFLDQRLDSHTQKETRDFTQLIKDIIDV